MLYYIQDCVDHRNSDKHLDKGFKNKTDLSDNLHWNCQFLEFIIIQLGSSLNYLQNISEPDGMLFGY